MSCKAGWDRGVGQRPSPRLGSSDQWDEEPGLQYSEALCERGGTTWSDQYSTWKEHFLEILCWIETEEITCIVSAQGGINFS